MAHYAKWLSYILFMERERSGVQFLTQSNQIVQKIIFMIKLSITRDVTFKIT